DRIHNQTHRPYYDLFDQEVSNFVGCRDPKEYLDWKSDMNLYFNRHEMSESKKVRFAKMRILGQAKSYWNHVQLIAIHRRHKPIETWSEMKDKLREKYLLESYRQRLLEQWQGLAQGNGSVNKYIERFEEFHIQCNMKEDPFITLARFRVGLR